MNAIKATGQGQITTRKVEEALSYWTFDCSMDLGIWGIINGHDGLRNEMAIDFNQESIMYFINYSLEGDVVVGKLKWFSPHS